MDQSNLMFTVKTEQMGYIALLCTLGRIWTGENAGQRISGSLAFGYLYDNRFPVIVTSSEVL